MDNIATEAELSAWLDEQDTIFQAEVAARKEAEKAALRAFKARKQPKRSLAVQAYVCALEMESLGS